MVNIIDALRNLLLVFQEENKNSFHEANSLFQHYQQSFKELYKDAPNLPLMFTNYCLGQIALREKKYDDAIFYYEKVLKENNSKPDLVLPDQDLADLYANLGSLLVNQNQFKQGEQYLEKALLIFQKYYSANDEKVLVIQRRINHAIAQSLKKQFKKTRL